jgi:hypothetical protein
MRPTTPGHQRLAIPGEVGVVILTTLIEEKVTPTSLTIPKTFSALAGVDPSIAGETAFPRGLLALL